MFRDAVSNCTNKIGTSRLSAVRSRRELENAQGVVTRLGIEVLRDGSVAIARDSMALDAKARINRVTAFQFLGRLRIAQKDDLFRRSGPRHHDVLDFQLEVFEEFDFLGIVEVGGQFLHSRPDRKTRRRFPAATNE